MNTPFQYAIFDPRPIPAAAETNEAIFASGQVLGIEVTVNSLAARCGLGNIDPQHLGGDASKAAIEVALDYWLPPAGTILATVRADLDSIGAMAVFSVMAAPDADILMSNEGGILRRIKMVANADKFARGGWPGARPLPSTDNPWSEEGASASDSRPLAAIAAAISDFRVPVADRVSTMETWLRTGVEPEQYRTQVERERMDMVAAIESGAIQTSVAANGKIAVVVSPHRAAMTVGYALAPVVVALNPEFVFQGGPKHAKFTVAQFEMGFADLKSATAELAGIEPGWGGSPTIAGSPQGVSSTLTTDQVVAVIEKFLK